MAKSDNKAWYYWWSPSDNRWYILAFCNKSPSCSRRQFQATTGNLSGKPEWKPGRFQQTFAKDFQSTYHRLIADYPVNWAQLPHDFLSALWEQIIPLAVELPPAQQRC
jgi:hypothetical protein